MTSQLALNHNDHVVQVEIAAVRGEIERVQREKDRAEAEAKAFAVKLRSDYRETFDELDRLAAEAQALRAAKEKEAVEAARHFNAWRSGFQREAQPQPGAPPKPPTPTAELKRLYRQIAARCHPDKSDDPNSHRLFIAAKTAYEARDLETIRMVHKAVMTIGNLRASTPAQRRYDLLRIRLDEARQQLEAARGQLLAAKPMMNAAETYKQRVAAIGKENANAEFVAALNQRVYELRNAIAQMKAPPPAVSPLAQTIFWRM